MVLSSPPAILSSTYSSTRKVWSTSTGTPLSSHPTPGPTSLQRSEVCFWQGLETAQAIGIQVGMLVSQACFLVTLTQRRPSMQELLQTLAFSLTTSPLSVNDWLTDTGNTFHWMNFAKSRLSLGWKWDREIITYNIYGSFTESLKEPPPFPPQAEPLLQALKAQVAGASWVTQRTT